MSFDTANTPADADRPAASDSVVEASPQGDLQTGPSMDMHEASDRAKIDGVVAQTRQDFPAGSDPGKFEHALRQRFDEVGLRVPEDEITRLVS